MVNTAHCSSIKITYYSIGLYIIPAWTCKWVTGRALCAYHKGCEEVCACNDQHTFTLFAHFTVSYNCSFRGIHFPLNTSCAIVGFRGPVLLGYD